MGKPTLKTIAARAGLSVTTVSRALKDGPELSAETKARVKQIAAELGYQPNRAGVRLRTGRTYVICLILNQADDMNEFARNLILGITSVVSGTRYHMLLVPQAVGQPAIEPVRYVLETGAADGMMMAHTTPQDERVKMLIENDFPFVTLGRTELSTPHPYYDVDNDDFTYRATQRLLELGRRRIMLLRPPAEFTYSGHQLAGYRRALYEAGLSPIETDRVTLYTPPPEIRAFIAAHTGQPNAPDGYICGSEGQALGIMAGLRDAGATVGREADIVVKETSNLFDFISPAISGFYEDFALAGEVMARMLLRRIEEAPPARDLQVLNRVVWRERGETPAKAARSLTEPLTS